MKYTCPHCNTKKYTKDTFDKHIHICKFIHTTAKEHAINRDSIEAIPSQELLLRYVLDLTDKHERLEKRVMRLEQSNSRIFRKNFAEYVQLLPPPTTPFDEWMQKLVVTQKHIEEVLFPLDIKECIRAVFQCALNSSTNEILPICAFTQKPNCIYFWENADKKWKLMQYDDFHKLILILSHRINRAYSLWAEQHATNIETMTESMQETMMVYMYKANGSNISHDQRILFLKQWLFNTIKTGE